MFIEKKFIDKLTHTVQIPVVQANCMQNPIKIFIYLNVFIILLNMYEEGCSWNCSNE